jgi:hypothetical protein
MNTHVTHRRFIRHPSWPTARFAMMLGMSVFALNGHLHAQALSPDSERPGPAPVNSDVSWGMRDMDIASGSATRQWLSKQETAANASAHRQTLSGPAMSRVYERYLKTFEQAVPEKLKVDGATSASK